MNGYYVWMRSTPGFYQQYDGRVKVYADNDNDAIEQAFIKLTCGIWKDRSRNMWKVDKVERII